MARGSDLHKGIVEGLELGVLELAVVEAEKVVHDDVAGQCREGKGEVHGLFARLELVHADGKSVNVSLDDVEET
jgi:hypothetical protein